MTIFSERHGFAPNDSEIVTRDATPELRSVVVDIAYEAGMNPEQLRRIVCRTLFVPPDPSNWSPFPNIDLEVRGLLQDAAWYDVYDVIEAIATELPGMLLLQSRGLKPTTTAAGYPLFDNRLNRFFRRKGIGWQLVDRKVEYRGPEAVELAIQEACGLVHAAAKPTAANELHEAIRDLGRRPQPEITGAIQHAMAALECVARDHVGTTQTLGDLVQRNREKFPPPLDAIITKAWGYTSNFGRHLVEGQPPTFEEAELMVGLSAVLARYLARKAD
jgi:hypothetical protein